MPTPPKKPAKKAVPKTAGQVAETPLILLDPETPIFNHLVSALPGFKRPTFQPWETHDGFMLRHEFSLWLYPLIYGRQS